MNTPEISVVMAVHNGQSSVEESARSILSQLGANFELIVVDDASTDGTPAVLERLAADSRVRFIRGERAGLTASLILGCAAARGIYIARQDCGDRSLPGRLAAQRKLLETHAAAALCSCATRFVGPRGETLYEVRLHDGDSTNSLTTVNLREIAGPAHHGAVMFRREAYERAGGYRSQFYFAQDLDLWTRMADFGQHWVSSEILYEATFNPRSISARYRRQQIESARIILECAQRRRAGYDETELLRRASSIRPDGGESSAREAAAALYFIGACLDRRRDPTARRYFLEALQTYPLHIRSAVKLITGALN